MAAVRVGISMLTLVPGKMGGSESYARDLCRGLIARTDVDVVAFVPRTARFAGEGLPSTVVPCHSFGQDRFKSAAVMTQLAMRGRTRRLFDALDVVHYPFTVPIPSRALPSVVTLHDLQHLDMPEMFSWQTRAFRRFAYDRAAQHAAGVVVPSAFVRDRAVAILGLDQARVSVVPHGIDHSVFSPTDVSREQFLLYPARVWRHKNHERLLAAFGVLRREQPALTLVLTGAGTEVFAGRPGVSARGVVPIADLVDLYRRAGCVVFPSLYEGFGAPILEAMSCGAPVAASRVASLPEICGEAAVLFDPNDPGAIVAGVLEALASSDDLSRRGLLQSKKFTWAASAERHARVYHQVAVR